MSRLYAATLSCTASAALRIALVILGCFLSSPGFALPPRWAELPPPPLSGGAMVLDPVRNRMLLVGGSSPATVWSLPLTGPLVWTELATQGSPPALSANGIIYDPLRDRLVTWVPAPGCVACGPSTTWVLRFDVVPPAWEILPTVGTDPSNRGGFSAIYDEPRDRMIMFGGFIGSFGTKTNEVDALTFSPTPTWSQLSPAGNPPTGRAEQTAIYDPNGDRMIVFGGVADSPQGVVTLDESWSLSLSGTPTWTFLTPTGSLPSARTGHSAVRDPLGQRMIVFGGGNGFADTWALSLTAGNVATWSSLATGPPGRASHVAAYDPINQRMMLYGGGYGGGSRSDLWALSLAGTPAWSQLSTFVTPPPAVGWYGATIDSVRDRMYVFEGSGTSEQTWMRSLGTDDGWASVTVGNPNPVARLNPVAVNDPAGDQALLFGGLPAGVTTYLDDTWGFAYGSMSWSKLTKNNDPRPPARSYAFGGFDRQRRKLIIYGGEGAGTPPATFRVLDDTWSFDAATKAWTQLAAGSFGGRWGVTGIYDPLRDRLVTFGGADTLATYDDVHVLNLAGGTWSALATQGSPPPLLFADHPEAVYDPAGDRMLVTVQGSDSPDVWALSLGSSPTWTQLSPAGRRPLPRSIPLVPDLERHRILLYSGSGGNDTWALYLDDSYLVDVPRSIPVATAFRLDPVRPNPTRGRPLVSFRLTGNAPARLELLDIQGRLVWKHDVGSLGAGAHTVRLGPTRSPGLYFLRLTEGEHAESSKFVVVE